MTMQEAIEKAQSYLQETLPEYSEGVWRLEEVETPMKGGTWLFTFTTTSEKKLSGNLTFQDFLRPFRVTKLVEVDSRTGELLAIRNKAA